MSTSVVAYKKLYEDIRSDIVLGKYKVGERILPEAALAKQHQISRMTVRKALDALVFDGYLTRKQGSGTFVNKPRIDTLQTYSLKDSMEQKKYQITNVIWRKEIMVASKEVAGKLSLSHKNKEVFVLERLRIVNNMPLVVQEAIVPAIHCPDLFRFDYRTESLYEGIRKITGHTIARIKEKINAVLADDTKASLLGVHPGYPILNIERISLLEDGRPIEFCHSWYRSDLYSIEREL